MAETLKTSILPMPKWAIEWSLSGYTILRKLLVHVITCYKTKMSVGFLILHIFFFIFTALMMLQAPLVISLSGTFKRYEVQRTVSELISIADVRRKADCPVSCMRYPFCYGFALDKRKSKCYLLGCGNNGNKFSTLPVYMYTMNTLLARGRNIYK